jgi:hypothetical protein
MTDAGFGADYEVKSSPFFKFDKVGARFVGIYRGRDERKNNLDATGKFPMQTVHEFELIEQFDTDINKFEKGDSVLYAKTGDGGVIINKTLEKIPFGSVIGVAFAEAKASTKPGQQGAHIIKVYNLSADPKYLAYVDKKTEVDTIVEDAVNNMSF